MTIDFIAQLVGYAFFGFAMGYGIPMILFWLYMAIFSFFGADRD